MFFKAILPTVPIQRPQWVERSIIWRCSSGMIKVRHGRSYGTLIVHEGFFHGETSVTHLKSKVEVCRMPDEASARELVEQLWEACRSAWIGEQVDKGKIPNEYLTLLKSFSRGSP